MASNRNTARRGFHRIWIAGKKLFVKPETHDRCLWWNKPQSKKRGAFVSHIWMDYALRILYPALDFRFNLL